VLVNTQLSANEGIEMAQTNHIKDILDAIRNAREMDIPLKITKYSPENKFPFKNKALSLWLSFLSLDIIILRRLSTFFIKRYLQCNKLYFVPGFKCIYGNIYGNNISLFNTNFVDYANIYIGDGTGFSYDNLVITTAHDINSMKNIYAKEIVIGKNVWITSRVTILAGVRIGSNSIIGAGSVVTRDIPPGVFAAGIPAKPLYRINQQEI
jgi:acetyltransferase-like isoleucine patch superfamily enzyme